MAWTKKTWDGLEGTNLNEFLVDGKQKTISANMNTNATPYTSQSMNDLEDRVNDTVANAETYDKKTWYESITPNADGSYNIILDGVSKKMKVNFTGENTGISATKMNAIEAWIEDFIGKQGVDAPPTLPTAPTIASIFIGDEPVELAYAGTVTQEGDNLYSALADLVGRIYDYATSSLEVTVTNGGVAVEGATVKAKVGSSTKTGTTDENGKYTFTGLKGRTYTVTATSGDDSAEVQKVVLFDNAETVALEFTPAEE